MPAMLDWKALTQEGGLLVRHDGAPPAQHAQIREMVIETDAGIVRAVVHPERGERVRTYNSCGASLGVSDQPVVEKVAVIEVSPDPGQPNKYVRIYLLPGGILVSTE